jgi:hypothetical protein
MNSRLTNSKVPLQRDASHRSSHSTPSRKSADHGVLLTIKHAAEHKLWTKKKFLKVTLVSDTLRLLLVKNAK